MIPKYCKIRQNCIHDMYRINCWLPINLGYCLPTMPTPFEIDILTSRFKIVALNMQIVNTRLDRPLKPGIRKKR